MATSIDIRGTEHGAQILTTEALAFVADLQRTFGRGGAGDRRRPADDNLAGGRLGCRGGRG